MDFERRQLQAEGTTLLLSGCTIQVAAACTATRFAKICAALHGIAVGALAYGAAKIYAGTGDRLQPNQTTVVSFWPVPVQLSIRGPWTSELRNDWGPVALRPPGVKFELRQTWGPE